MARSNWPGKPLPPHRPPPLPPCPLGRPIWRARVSLCNRHQSPPAGLARLRWIHEIIFILAASSCSANEERRAPISGVIGWQASIIRAQTMMFMFRVVPQFASGKKRLSAGFQYCNLDVGNADEATMGRARSPHHWIGEAVGGVIQGNEGGKPGGEERGGENYKGLVSGRGSGQLVASPKVRPFEEVRASPPDTPTQSYLLRLLLFRLSSAVLPSAGRPLETVSQ